LSIDKSFADEFKKRKQQIILHLEYAWFFQLAGKWNIGNPWVNNV
jgi:hypothetical protein